MNSKSIWLRQGEGCPGTETSLWILIVNNYPSPQGNSFFRTVEVDLEGKKNDGGGETAEEQEK